MTLIVCPLRLVEEMATIHAPSHILTLIGPAAGPPSCAAAPSARRLHLLFNDIVEPAEGLILPSAEHIADLLAFGRDWSRAAPMLVHCWAGISRSTAAAYILACDRSPPGTELDLAYRLRAVSASATPNRLMIALADEVLGRGGAMIAAVEEIGPGLAATTGNPFVLRLDGD
jgi:predicted protein tyrosine phosphatase